MEGVRKLLRLVDFASLKLRTCFFFGKNIELVQVMYLGSSCPTTKCFHQFDYICFTKVWLLPTTIFVCCQQCWLMEFSACLSSTCLILLFKDIFICLNLCYSLPSSPFVSSFNLPVMIMLIFYFIITETNPRSLHFSVFWSCWSGLTAV